MKKSKLVLGTGKGLVVFENSQNGWKPSEVSFRGMSISAYFFDSKTKTEWIGMYHKHWGPKLYKKTDGKNWESIVSPSYPSGAKLSNGQPASLKKIWSITRTTLNDKDRIWVGTQPGGLFYSDDNGEQFHLLESLWNLPSRIDGTKWFGTGTNQPFVHSIVAHPNKPEHLYIAVSSAGVFETKDYGKSWEPRNDGLIAAYLPNPQVEIGHDPHCLLICKSNPNVLWQQNHCGIFRSTNRGEYWENVTDKNGLANYGFAMGIDHSNPEVAWVIPATNDIERIPKDLALCVCKTEDGGKSWTPIRKGLPQGFTFDLVFRHAFAIDENHLAFGTTNGNLYYSEDSGTSWQCISTNLQRIENVSFVE